MKVGDRIKKRGSGALGTIEEVCWEEDPCMRSRKSWVRVKWDDGMLPKERPRNCSVAELERV